MQHLNNRYWTRFERDRAPIKRRFRNPDRSFVVIHRDCLSAWGPSPHQLLARTVLQRSDHLLSVSLDRGHLPRERGDIFREFALALIH
jgi:hypothetical protein